MRYLKLEQQDNVQVLYLTNGEQDNTFTLDVLDEWNQVLQQINDQQENTCLLITADHPKTFCNGINLDWLQQQDSNTRKEFLWQLENLLLKLATLNKPTIAAINGNCYAGGALIAAACDFRYMREDRGRFCYSEVKIELPFTPVMMDIVQLLPAKDAMYELSITADAWGGDICERRGVIDRACPEKELFPTAMEWAQHMASKHWPTLSVIKQGLRARVTELARERQLI